MRRSCLPAALAVAASALASPALADVTGRLYERALMAEADRRCGLFTPEVRNALSVSRIQARNAAVRARGDAVAVEQRARLRAATLPCASPDLQLAAGRVRQAHAGWARLFRMEFPSGGSSWRADRTRSTEMRWRAVQTAGETSIGLAGASAGSALYTVVRYPRKETPALARLTVGRRTFLAAARTTAPKGLTPPGKGRAWAFRFPPAASEALAAASVRDTARLTFIGSDGSGTRSAPFEIGDYAAARAFVGG